MFLLSSLASETSTWRYKMARAREAAASHVLSKQGGIRAECYLWFIRPQDVPFATPDHLMTWAHGVPPHRLPLVSGDDYPTVTARELVGHDRTGIPSL